MQASDRGDGLTCREPDSSFYASSQKVAFPLSIGESRDSKAKKTEVHGLETVSLDSQTPSEKGSEVLLGAWPGPQRPSQHVPGQEPIDGHCHVASLAHFMTCQISSLEQNWCLPWWALSTGNNGKKHCWNACDTGDARWLVSSLHDSAWTVTWGFLCPVGTNSRTVGLRESGERWF